MFASSLVASSLAAAADTPEVRFVTPVEGQLVGGVFRVVIEVASSQPISQVSLFRDDAVIGIDVEPPFEFAWDTRRLDEGPSRLTAKALDARFHEGRARLSVTIDHTPATVSLLAPKDGAVVVGLAQLAAEAEDRQGVHVVRFLINGNLLGEVSRPPYLLPWDTNAIPNGRYTVEARAFDEAGNSATSAPATVRVSNFNRHPVLTRLAPQLQVVEDAPWSLALEAVDPDGARDPLAYHAANLPPWASFDARTGVLQGTPSMAESSLEAPHKMYPDVRFEVCDPEPLCDATQTTIMVMNRNRAPTMEPVANQTLKEEESLSIPLVVADPDGDQITCKSRLLPHWATLHASTCILTGSPFSQVASLEEPTVVYDKVQLIACDQEPLCTTQQLSITVTNVNQSPVWGQLKPQQVDEGKRLVFEVSAFDADQDRSVFTAISIPDGAMFNDLLDGTAQFSWSPHADQSGSYDAVLSVTDGDLTATAKIPITVRETILAMAGLVTDADDNPIADVLIDLSARSRAVTRTVTDQRGAYLFSGLKPGDYVVKPDYVPPRTFSTRAKKIKPTFFVPAIQRIKLAAEDQRGVDFLMGGGTGE